jgi:Gas vesicle protein
VNPPSDGRQVALVDLLDRVLATGVVLSGDVTISLADIDLIRLDLRLLLASVASIDAGGASALTLGREKYAILSSSEQGQLSLPVPGDTERRP